MKKKKKIVLMWQILEPDGTPMSFLTVQEEIATKLCKAREGRKMQQVAVEV